MSDTHEIIVRMPDEIEVTLRGHTRKLDTYVLPDNVVVWLIEKGVQRGSNDPLGALFKKGENVSAEAIDKYWDDLVSRWEKGEVAKTRSGGLGRTTDPLQREIKRLANAEIDANIAKLLAHHGVTRKEFDEQFRAKYVKNRIEKFGERLKAEAEANLAKLKAAAEVDDEDLLDLDDEESDDDESEDEDDESEIEHESKD
jgi:hypothetical protein